MLTFIKAEVCFTSVGKCWEINDGNSFNNPVNDKYTGPLGRTLLKLLTVILQSVTKFVDRSGVNGNNLPFPPFQCCKINNCVLFHMILGCNALSIVLQQIYATLKRGSGGLIHKIAQLFTMTDFWA